MKTGMSTNSLEAGDPAPQFQTIDASGEKVDLANYKDDFVLLVFLRYAGCPWCNLAIHRLSIEHNLLVKNGCRVLTFVQSTTENVQKNIYDRHDNRPPFPIIADQKRVFYDQYAIKTSLKAAAKSVIDIPYWLQSVFKHGHRQVDVDGNMLLVPAQFLVSPGDQKIVLADYGSSYYEHETFTAIYEHLTFDRN